MLEALPFYTLQIGVCFCRCDIRVNDIPILVEDVSDSRIDIELPLNPHIFTGDNTLSIRLKPAGAGEQGPAVDLDNPNVFCSVEIVRRPYTPEVIERTTIASIVYRGASPDPLSESSPELPGVTAVQRGAVPREVAAARVVTLATPLPEWRWVRAPVIEPGPEVVRDLIPELQRMWAMLRDKDVAGLRAMMATNAREIQAAYYQPDLSDAWRMIGIEELLRNPEGRLKPMPDDLRLEVFANGRLARLDDADGKSPIWFHEGDTGLDAFIATWFCRAPTGGWLMIR